MEKPGSSGRLRPASLEDVNSRVMGPARIRSGTVASFIAAAAAFEIGGFGTDEEQRCQRVRVLGENAFQGVLKHVYADVQCLHLENGGHRSSLSASGTANAGPVVLLVFTGLLEKLWRFSEGPGGRRRPQPSDSR